MDIQLDPKRFAQEAVLEFDDGDVIFTEGEDTHEMYIVQKGEVVITKKTSKGDVILAHLKKGDFLGEMSLLESLPRSASAKASGPTSLLSIQPGGFLLKIRRDPTFAFEMLQALSRRIRVTNEKLIHNFNQKSAEAEQINNILSETEFNKDQANP